jgi:hypothetical protein
MTKEAKPLEVGLASNPLDELDPLAAHFYAPAAATKRQPKARSKGRQPLEEGRTFRLVTFSFYEDDVARLDALLKQARASGRRRANRSQIVRLALRQVDVAALPDEV